MPRTKKAIPESTIWDDLETQATKKAVAPDKPKPVRKTPVKRKPRTAKTQKSPVRFWVGVGVLASIALLFIYVEFFVEKPVPVWPVGHEIYGVDVSHYQKDVNWQHVRESQITFAFIKATEGKSLKDKKFDRNWSEAGKAGLMRGAYHFYRPRSSPEKQANHFVANVTLQPGDLPPVLDVEHRGLKPIKAFRQDIKVWLNLVERSYGTKPIIYTGYKFYKDYLEGHFDEYPLWIAHYKVPKLAMEPTEKAKLHFWQHTDGGSVKGIEGNVDCNVFYGSMRQLREVCLK